MKKKGNKKYLEEVVCHKEYKRYFYPRFLNLFCFTKRHILAGACKGAQKVFNNRTHWDTNQYDEHKIVKY